MGLFGNKKTCSICGGKVGLLGYKLAGEDHLCSDCRLKCTPGNPSFKSMTVEDVRENMQIAEENRRLCAKEFHATRKFFTGANMDKPVIFVDEDHGWFINAAKNDGWLYHIDNISYYEMRLSTSPIEEQKEKGFLEWLFEPDFYAPYPELPKCPRDEKIIGAYLDLQLAENELGVDHVEFDVFPGLFTSERDIYGSYECCHQFFQFMQEFQQNYFQNAGNAASAASVDDDTLETIKKMHDLVKQGILTQEEFDAKKKELLNL